jgi:carbohydrate diacid regulator
MKAATEREIGVIDAEGTVIACFDPEQVGTKLPKLARVVSLSDDQMIHFSGKTVMPLTNFGTSFDFAVYVDGEDELSNSLCRMAQVTLNCTKTYYEEKHDKVTFVKNIITDNICSSNITLQST